VHFYVDCASIMKKEFLLSELQRYSGAANQHNVRARRNNADVKALRRRILALVGTPMADACTLGLRESGSQQARFGKVRVSHPTWRHVATNTKRVRAGPNCTGVASAW